MSDFHRTTERRARRRHACEACPDPIEPGTWYAVGAGAYEGRMYRWRMHRYCLAVTHAWLRIAGRDWEDLPETTAERLEDAASACDGACAAEVWREIARDLADLSAEEVARVRAMYVERVGCPECGAWVGVGGWPCAHAGAPT